MKIVFKVLFICLSFVSFSQSGPGGIGNSTNNSFWLDANELNLSNNTGVNVFTDISGNSNNFSQNSSSAQPKLMTNVVNGLPALRFDGVNDRMKSGAIPAIESNNLTWFIVYKKNSIGGNALLGGNYSSNPKQWMTYSHSGGNNVYSVHYSSGSISHVSYLDDYSTFNFSSSHITPTNIRVYEEGILKQSKTAGYVAPTGHNFVSLGCLPYINNYFLDGDVAEVFVYNTALTNLEREIVENYLGAKYGLAIPTDRYAFETTHNLGVIGIGDNGTDTHSNSKGYDQVQISNPLGMVSGEYLFTGHTNDEITLLENTDLPVGISTHSRWKRTWRVDETGDVGSLTVTVDVSGMNGFADPATYSLLVDTDGNFSNATIVLGSYNAGTQKMTFNVDLNNGDFFTLAGEFNPKNIHSVQTGNWSDINTWDCVCLPTIYDTTFIDNNDNVTVDINAHTARLTITSLATLTMNQNFDLNLYENFNVLGSLIATDGQVSFVGLIDQTLNGGAHSTDYNKILIDNPNGSTINFTNGTSVLNNTLSPNSGVMNINSGGVFIVNSTSSTTSGRIGAMQSGFSIVGNVSVRRFLPAGNAAERTISSPVIGANLSEWDATISISGVGFPDGCAYGGGSCYFSCKQFKGGDFASDYIDVTNPNEPLENGSGYELFIGDDLNTFSGATITSTGTLRNGNDISYTTMPNGWNIVGNPYASPVLFSTIDLIQVSQYYYIFDAATGSYQWYDKNSNTSSIPDLANGNLAIGQAYWLYAGLQPELIYKQSDKASATATFVRANQTDESIYLTLSQEGTTYKNIVSIDFNEISVDGKDSLDVLAFTIGNQKSASLYLKTDEELLAKNYLHKNGFDKIVDMSVKILNDGYYSLSVSNFKNNTEYKFITLYDNKTKETIELKNTPSYNFYSEAGEFDRFTVVLSNKKVIGNSLTIEQDNIENVTIKQIGNSINIEAKNDIKGISNIKVYNLLGQEVAFSKSLNIQKGDNIVFVTESLSGVYIVAIQTVNGLYTKKIMF